MSPQRWGFFLSLTFPMPLIVARCTIYLDESGDLGFSFAAPYRRGGSSRHLTLGAVVCPDESKKHIKRFVVNFYKRKTVPSGTEVKWAELDQTERTTFAINAHSLVKRHQQLSLATITVYKPNVMPHIRLDPNKLYNYMVALLLLPIMRNFTEVSFVPDRRSIRVKSGNSLHDYLQTKLWFEEGVATVLNTYPTESKDCKPLHFADYLSGVVQSSWEDGNHGPRTTLEALMLQKRLFF